MTLEATKIIITAIQTANTQSKTYARVHEGSIEEVRLTLTPEDAKEALRQELHLSEMGLMNNYADEEVIEP